MREICLPQRKKAASILLWQKTHALQPQKSRRKKLTVEKIDGDISLTSAHGDDKNTLYPFVALLTGDSFIMRRQYPEMGFTGTYPTARAWDVCLWHCKSTWIILSAFVNTEKGGIPNDTAFFLIDRMCFIRQSQIVYNVRGHSQ